MFYHLKDYKEKTLDELKTGLAAINSSIEKWNEKIAEAKKDHRYKQKFKNQPPPNVNPALLELKQNIETEIKERENG